MGSTIILLCCHLTVSGRRNTHSVRSVNYCVDTKTEKYLISCFIMFVSFIVERKEWLLFLVNVLIMYSPFNIYHKNHFYDVLNIIFGRTIDPFVQLSIR